MLREITMDLMKSEKMCGVECDIVVFNKDMTGYSEGVIQVLHDMTYMLSIELGGVMPTNERGSVDVCPYIKDGRMFLVCKEAEGRSYMLPRRMRIDHEINVQICWEEQDKVSDKERWAMLQLDNYELLEKLGVMDHKKGNYQFAEDYILKHRRYFEIDDTDSYIKFVNGEMKRNEYVAHLCESYKLWELVTIA